MTAETVISGVNLSCAWGTALLKCYAAPGGSLNPAIVEFHAPQQGERTECLKIRKALDEYIHTINNHEESVETIAGTIFPQSIWNISRGDRSKLFDLYTHSSPRILRYRANRNGIYFNRMIAFSSDGDRCINQLEHIINTWNNGNSRRSALQAAIFDPHSDHTDQRQRGFPCLQQLAFYPQGDNGRKGLAVIGFYATQTLIEKGYGNYLGLYRLGQFMAREMGLKLSKITCISAALKLSNGKPKSDFAALVQKVKALMDNVCK
jgi:thymidylate synthase